MERHTLIKRRRDDAPKSNWIEIIRSELIWCFVWGEKFNKLKNYRFGNTSQNKLCNRKCCKRVFDFSSYRRSVSVGISFALEFLAQKFAQKRLFLSDTDEIDERQKAKAIWHHLPWTIFQFLRLKHRAMPNRFPVKTVQNLDRQATACVPRARGCNHWKIRIRKIFNFVSLRKSH